MEYVPLVLWECFGVHEDDIWDITGESDGELMKAGFRGVTGESDSEPMLSCNQLKVSESLQRQRPRRNQCRSSDLRGKKGFSLEVEDNQ